MLDTDWLSVCDHVLIIVLLLSHALSPVGRTAFWHACPITESHNNTLHSIYCFHFTSRIKYSRPICMGVYNGSPIGSPL